MRQGNLFDFSTEFFIEIRSDAHAFFDFRVDAFNKIFLWQTDAQPFDIPFQRLRKIRHFFRSRRGIFQIMTADHIHQNRRVFHRLGNGADLIKAGAKRD